MVRDRWFLLIGMLLGIVAVGVALQQPPQSAQSIPRNPHAKVTNPHGPLAMPCQDCHTYTSWKPIRSMPEFNHDHTRYPLRGMHEKVGCKQCHTSLVFHSASTHCADCHADIHRRKFGANCENCHSVKGWQTSLQAIRNHQNRFPLVGAHALVDCEACHKSAAVGQFKGLSTACVSCHMTDFRTPNFDHVAMGFPSTCESCHTMDTWFGAKFDHMKFTGFALTGMHATLDCNACHLNNKFKGTPADCFSCHKDAFNATRNPSHPQLGLPHDCGTCHSTVDWLNARFDHVLYAKYALTGAHASLTCAQCHINGQYTSTPTDCYSCHKQNFTSTTKPNHVSSGFPTDCSVCHTTAAWIPSSFDHAKTAFPLIGAHQRVQCALCHVNNQYKGLPTDCYTCHRDKFVATNNPSHLTLGFPHDCTVCHNMTDWLNAKFDHTAYAHYALTGQHAKLTCAQCHVNGQFAGTPSDCYSCHRLNYNTTTNPNHVTAGFPTDCSFCHSTAGWSPSSFDHSKTSFPLTGAHLSTQCMLCHVNNNYTTVPTDCYACHKDKYTAAKDPNHITAGFPTTCAICHTTTTWAGAVFDHSKTPFPLTGAHTAVACAKCHINNVYAGTPTDCYACHKVQYMGTTNPNHVTAGFPTSCLTCHTTASWLGATFNHTWFDVRHGGGGGVCATCHTNSSNYAVFTCTNCHGKSATDQKHSGVPGYVYSSAKCYVCHANAGGGN